MIKVLRKKSINELINEPIWVDFHKDILLKLALISFVIIAFSFIQTGLLPVATLLLILVLILKNPSKTISKVRKFPLEIKLLNIWFIFAGFTGVFVSINLDGFITSYISLFFIILIINVLYITLSYDIRLIKIIFLGILISGIIQVIAIYFGFSNVVSERSGRELGLANNPNSLGLKMVYSSVAVLIFLGMMKKIRIIPVVIYLFLLIMFFNVILASGSKKSLLSFFLFICLSLSMFLANKYKKINIGLILFFFAILSIIAYALAPILLEGTIVGRRFHELDEKGGLENDIRYQMYQYGMQLFSENPFFGIGLNNYKDYFYTGQYSHSDYIESLTSTGFFGFIIYQVSFFAIIIRSLFLLNKVEDKLVRFYVAMAAVSILTLKIIGLGIILYVSINAMIIYAIFSTLTFQIINDKIKNK